jgi:CelD/BcsL family acetyltransferase involved in cellulose biosynthesis
MIQTQRSYWDAPLVDYPTNGKAATPSIRIQAITDTQSFSELEAQWTTLTLESRASIFQTFDWQYYWWKHFGSADEHHLHILLFYESETLIGIAPFFIQSHLLLHYRVFARLMLLGSGLQASGSPVYSLDKEGPSDILDLIIRPGYEHRVTSAMVDYWETHLHLWDELNLQNVREDGIIYQYLLPHLGGRNYRIRKKITDICPKITLPDSAETIIPKLVEPDGDSKARSGISTLENDDYAIEDVSADRKVVSALQTLTHLHQKRWNAKGFPGLFSDSRFEQFQRDIIQALANKGWLWAKNVQYQGSNIATHLGFTFNGQTHTYLSDHDYERIALSDTESLVLGAMLNEAITSQCQVLDMGRGEAPYKFQVTSSAVNNWEFSVRPPLSGLNQSRKKDATMTGINIIQNVRSRWRYERAIAHTIFEEHGLAKGAWIHTKHFWQRLNNHHSASDLLSRLGIHKPDLFFGAYAVSNDEHLIGDMETRPLNPKLESQTLSADPPKNVPYLFDHWQDPEAIGAAQPEWDALEAQFGSPMLQNAWTASCARAISKDLEPYLLVTRYGGKLHAIAPMSRSRQVSHRWELLGSTLLNEPGGFLYHDEESLDATLEQLLDHNQPIYLKGLRQTSREVQRLEHLLIERNFIRLRLEERKPFVAIRGNWKQFEKQLSSSRRSSMRRLQRQAEKHGALSFEMVAPTADTYMEPLAEMMRVEAASWKGRAGSAIQTDPQLTTFFNTYAREMAGLGELRIFFLKIEGQVIAAQFTVEHANRLWIFKIGHDEEWNFCSPGILLMHHVVQYCFDNQLESCEFLGNDESWLHIWANDIHSLFTYKIYPKTLRGLGYMGWDQTATYVRRIGSIIRGH